MRAFLRVGKGCSRVSIFQCLADRSIVRSFGRNGVLASCDPTNCVDISRNVLIFGNQWIAGQMCGSEVSKCKTAVCSVEL